MMIKNMRDAIECGCEVGECIHCKQRVVVYDEYDPWDDKIKVRGKWFKIHPNHYVMLGQKVDGAIVCDDCINCKPEYIV